MLTASTRFLQLLTVHHPRGPTHPLEDGKRRIETSMYEKDGRVVLNEIFIRKRAPNVNNDQDEKVLARTCIWTPDFNPETKEIMFHTKVILDPPWQANTLYLTLEQALDVPKPIPHFDLDTTHPVDPVRELFKALVQKHVPTNLQLQDGSVFIWTDAIDARETDGHQDKCLCILDKKVISLDVNGYVQPHHNEPYSYHTETKWYPSFNDEGVFQCRIETINGKDMESRISTDFKQCADFVWFDW